MRSFDSLSRDGQRRRLRALANAALEAYGIANAQLSFCSDTQNTVFRVDAAGQRYALRIHPPGSRSTAAIHAELAWLAALNHDLGLRVPEPVPTRDRQPLCVVEMQGVPEPRTAVLLRWVAGTPLESRVTTARVAQLGRLMAQLHEHATTFVLPPGTDRDRDDWPGMGYWPLTGNQSDSFLNPDQHALCAAAAQRAAEVIALVDPARNLGIIHSDVHFANCLDCGDELGLIDFDDCQFAPFTSDLAITLTYLDSRPDYERLRHVLLDSYAARRQLPQRADAELNAFMVERGLRLILWVASWPSLDHFSFGRGIIASALNRCARYLDIQTSVFTNIPSDEQTTPAPPSPSARA
jgi:Ser/Thr protein kinase RdoA (MazF antagonist)